MQAGALRPYERSLMTREPLRLHHADGGGTALEIDRYLDPADAADLDALHRALAPVLDIGCGPGRIVAALAGLGLMALGIDIAPTAVNMTRARGLNALRRNVFAPVPGEGRWQTALLLDGNIGIGGDAHALLERVRQVVSPTGRVIVETHADAWRDDQLVVRFTRTGRPIGPSFPWAHVGADALGRYAEQVGFGVAESWQGDGRSFVMLVPVPR